jgi:cell division protein FtsW
MDASIYRLRLRDLLVVCVISLLLLGVLMVQSASVRVSDAGTTFWTGPAAKHLIMVGGALLAFFVVGSIDHRKLAGNPKISLANPVVLFYGVTLFLCAMVNVPGLGRKVNGAQRWIGFGPVQLQPSELAKWAVVLLLAWALSRPNEARRDEVRQHFGKFLLLCVAIGAPCLAVVAEDFGTAALIGLAAVVIMIAARVRTWHLAAVIPPILGIGFWFVYHREYRWRRMTSFLHPFADPQGEGYHMVQSLLSFSSGGLLGKGIGNGVQKLGYLPEDTTDFIFAVICEELGLFGALLTIALYLGIAFVGYQLLRERKDPFTRLLVFGVTITVCLQAMINIAVATVSVPTKGLSLPLVSAGGSGLVITGAALGLLYSVARREDTEAEATPMFFPALTLA